MSLGNMFSHTVGSLLILVMVSLTVKKLFNSMYSHLFIFFHYFPCPRRYIGKNIATWDISNFTAYAFL